MELKRLLKEQLPKRMLKNKKGIFFTLIAVALLGIVLFSYTATYSYSLQQKSRVVEARVNSMNKMIREVDSDMENAIYIAGYRALIGMEDHVANTGTFFNDTEIVFRELFINGTVEGTDSSIMLNNTFPDWLEKINRQANTVGMNLSLDIDEVDIYHTGPWTVRVRVNSTLNVSDIKNTANWTQTKEIHSDISILGFEDPWYAVYTSNNIVKRINRTIYEGNFTNSTNTTNIRDHVNKTMYTNFTGAPNFLMRFENNFESSENGIESFVSKPEVSPYHTCTTETSSIDSIYWQCNVSISTYKAENWPGFRIDNETGMYNETRIGRYMMEDHII